MKKMSFLVALVMISLSALAQTTVKLPVPDKQVATTLYEALQTRHSVRSYQNKDVDNATLAQVLWAACGYSREAEKKITAASALNRQDIEVYVIKAAGAYRYDVESNALVQLSGKDLRREVAAGQQSVASAPVMLVLASNQGKFGSLGDAQAAQRLGTLDAGYVSQNIYLACTALKLGTVARVTMNVEVLKKELGLGADHLLLLNHPIGWEESK